MSMFDRRGDPVVRIHAIHALAEKLHVTDTSDFRTVMEERLADARAGRMGDAEVRHFSEAIDLLQRLEAFDHPWVFGNRYLNHRFISTDPICPSCASTVPHRTILVCPTCNSPGPWTMQEKVLQSSYAHYALAEQVAQLVNNELLLDGRNRADGMATAMPRGGAKSTWLCEIVAEWLVLTGRSNCLLLLSNTTTQVIERAIEIKDELESNELIIKDFGKQAATRQERRIWKQDDFVLASGARVVARGAMQSMRGVKNKEHRPDVVISDDSDDEKYMTTADQSRKLLDWWDTRVIPACHPNSLFMFHGTVLGEQALLWQLMKGNRGLTSAKMTIKAMQDGPGCEKCGMPTSRVGPFDCPVCDAPRTAVAPHSFWGSRFTVQALESIKRKIGHWAWQSEFQQEPHDDSTSWFEKDWLDDALAAGEELAPVPRTRRRIIPWSIIANTLNGAEAVSLATKLNPAYETRDGELGPYQMILHSWDPAWARAKPREQMSCWMAGLAVGLTWDDRMDVFWMDRARGLKTHSDYRRWMYETWIDYAIPGGDVERQGQAGMIVERNGAGVIFQSDVEENWGSVPLIDHQTGVEKHSLEDGIPGMASWFKDRRVIIRGFDEPDDGRERIPGLPGMTPRSELAEELVYELRMSGRCQYTDMMMTLWFAWAYMNRWIRDVRDPARYEELARRTQRMRRFTK